MADLTPDFVKGSFILVLVVYIIAFGFQVYMMYLNWKQSRVNNQMGQLISEVKEIKKYLKNKNKPKKKK